MAVRNKKKEMKEGMVLMHTLHWTCMDEMENEPDEDGDENRDEMMRMVVELFLWMWFVSAFLWIV